LTTSVTDGLAATTRHGVTSHARIDWLHHVFPPISHKSCALLSRVDSARRAVVFVHGFMGDPVSTWSHFHDIGTIVNDHGWDEADLFFLGYDSARLDIRSASWLVLEFLRGILPTPPEELFVTAYRGRTLPVRSTIRSYEELYLVGHSLGGVIVRDVVRLGLRDTIRQLSQERDVGDADVLFGAGTLEWYLAKAKLRLFAPAIGGARAAGMLGLLNAVGMSAMLAWSRSKHELEHTSIVLAEIRRETEEFFERFPQLCGLSALIVWAGRDNVVSPVEYRSDRTGMHFLRATHKSICKPTAKFLLPVKFVGIGNDAQG
jgi:hypothetical protein